MALLIEKPWTTQPYRTVGVNWSNPLTRGLLGAWLPYQNVIGGPAVIQGTTVTRGISNDGVAWRNSQANSNNYVKVERGPFTYTQQVTFEAIVRVKAFVTTVGSAGNLQGIISQFQSDSIGTSYVGPILRIQGNKARFGLEKSGSVYLADSEVLSTNRTYHLLGSYDQKNVSIYVNGCLQGSAAYAGTFDNNVNTFISIASDYVVWATTLGEKRTLNGDIFLARIYNVGKTAAEAAALAANPWQLFTGVETLSVPTYYPAAFPTLSNARVTSLTSTQGVPNVDYAF